MTAPKAFRDQAISGDLYRSLARYTDELVAHSSAPPAGESIETQARYKQGYIDRLGQAICLEYPMGIDLAVWSESTTARVGAMVQAADWIDESNVYPTSGGFKPWDFDTVKAAWCIFCLLGVGACLSPSTDMVATLATRLVHPASTNALFDQLVGALLPGPRAKRKYRANKYAQPWTDPVLAALALPQEQRSAAIAAHLGNWIPIMRKYGFPAKPKETYQILYYYAYEVAVAVCLYDIDDSAFRAHPRYPVDMVDYYRAHVRHLRPAIRVESVVAPVAVLTRQPVVRRSDLATSKSKGFKRWLELVCDGDSGAVRAVLDELGKPKTPPAPATVCAALSEAADQAIYADLKDDDTVLAQIQSLAQQRGVPEFVPLSEAESGVNQIRAIMVQFDRGMSDRGYSVFALPSEEDAWCAIVVATKFKQEYLELSADLRIELQVVTPSLFR